MHQIKYVRTEKEVFLLLCRLHLLSYKVPLKLNAIV